MCVITNRVDGQEVRIRTAACPCGCPQGWISHECDQPEEQHRTPTTTRTISEESSP